MQHGKEEIPPTPRGNTGRIPATKKKDENASCFLSSSPNSLDGQAGTQQPSMMDDLVKETDTKNATKVNDVTLNAVAEEIPQELYSIKNGVDDHGEHDETLSPQSPFGDSANDVAHLIKMNIFIGFRFVLGLYMWFSELTTPIRDPYRYFNWDHSVTGLITSSLVFLWKAAELYLSNECNWPYSRWLSMLSLSGATLFFLSGILVLSNLEKDRLYSPKQLTESTVALISLIGVGILCFTGILEVFLGMSSIFAKNTSRANVRSWRTVAASSLQAGSFLCLIIDAIKEEEFLRGFAAFLLVLEGIALSGSKISTEQAFLCWNTLFKIISATAFFVAVGTFHAIIRLNETYWSFPPFFPMDRGLVLPFYLILACLWFDADVEMSQAGKSYTNLNLMIIIMFRVIPTILVLVWIESTATSTFLRLASTNYFEKSPILIISCALLTVTTFAKFIVATNRFLKVKKKQRDMGEEEQEITVPLNEHQEATGEDAEDSSSLQQQRQDQSEINSNDEHARRLSIFSVFESVNITSKNAYLYEAYSVFGPAGDLFRFLASTLSLCLSIILYNEVTIQNGKPEREEDFVGNRSMLLSIAIGTVYLLHTFCWTKVLMDLRHGGAIEQEKYTLSEDTYTLMMSTRPLRQAWLLGFAVFALQATLTYMVIVAEVTRESQGNDRGGKNLLYVPFDVSLTTRIGQIAGMVIILLYQSDYWTASTLLEIRSIGGVKKGLGILFPTTIRLIQSMGVVVASTILILQSDSIIDLVKDYTAILFISEIDDFVFTLADNGYLGRGLKHDAEAVKEREVDDVSEHPIRSIGFVTIFGVMMGSLTYVMYNQRDGIIFRRVYPDCVNVTGVKRINLLKFGNGECDWELNYKECEFDGGDCIFQNMIYEAHVLYEYPDCRVPYKYYIGNGRCDGGPYNTKECGFDGKDCDKFNSEYPNCNVTNPSWVGDGICDGDIKIMNGTSEVREYHNEECLYDGGDCAPTEYPKCIIYNPYEDIFSTGISRLKSGHCTKKFNVEECDWDGGDCLQFNIDYPDCDAEEPSWIADGICNGGLANTVECGWDGGDCDVFFKKHPNCAVLNDTSVTTRIGDRKCTRLEYNTAECGFEGGDCNDFREGGIYENCKVKEPSYLGNRLCNGDLYNVSECDWDGGDCK